jgi:hypothetical protein
VFRLRGEKLAHERGVGVGARGGGVAGVQERRSSKASAPQYASLRMAAICVRQFAGAALRDKMR